MTSAVQKKKQETRKTRDLRLHGLHDLTKMTSFQSLFGTEHLKQGNQLQRPWGSHTWHEKSNRGQSGQSVLSKAERPDGEGTAYSILETTSVPLAFRLIAQKALRSFTRSDGCGAAWDSALRFLSLSISPSLQAILSLSWLGICCLFVCFCHTSQSHENTAPPGYRRELDSLSTIPDSYMM